MILWLNFFFCRLGGFSFHDFLQHFQYSWFPCGEIFGMFESNKTKFLTIKKWIKMECKKFEIWYKFSRSFIDLEPHLNWFVYVILQKENSEEFLMNFSVYLSHQTKLEDSWRSYDMNNVIKALLRQAITTVEVYF